MCGQGEAVPQALLLCGACRVLVAVTGVVLPGGGCRTQISVCRGLWACGEGGRDQIWGCGVGSARWCGP